MQHCDNDASQLPRSERAIAVWCSHSLLWLARVMLLQGCGVCQEKVAANLEERKKEEKVNEEVEAKAAAAANAKRGRR